MRAVIRSVLLIVSSLYSLAQAFEVPVNVTEPAGIARKAEPVSGGISLPAGMFKPGQANFALFDAEKSIPVQVSELVVGPKGFVRWVLLDFQLDLQANETKKLLLKTGEPAVPVWHLKVCETAEVVSVDTGRISFEINKDKTFSLFENVAVDGNKTVNRGSISYTDGLVDKRYYADVPNIVKIHYSGPMRVTIEVRGMFRDDRTAQMAYCTYITAWAGRSDILIRHSLINSRPDRRYFAKVKSSRIELKPTITGGAIVLGADKPVKVNSGSEITLHQGLEEERNRELESAKLIQDEKQLWSGRGAQGWISYGSIWVGDRLFRTDPPRLLSVSSEGTLVLEAAGKFFQGREEGQNIVGRPYASQDEYRWLYDCSAHSSEYRIDFNAAGDGNALAAKAHAAASRIWAFAPGQWYGRCGVLAVGRFGTLEDEIACHKNWGWTAGREPDCSTNPSRFVGYEDNHYESEADSAEGLLLMFLRTGKRGFFDEAEAWVRYHTDLQTWRTEGWQWKDGGIWFPQGGPQGNRPVRDKANLEYTHWNNGTKLDRTLWRLAMAKSCYCHFYGAGLVDWFCLTGDREVLYAALDNCQTKWDEFTHFRNFTPGKSNIASTRGFGRGFYVAVRTWMVQPDNPLLQKLVNLCRDTFINLPDEYLDERGVYAPIAHKYPKTYIKDGIKQYMAKNNITVDDTGTFRDGSGSSWKWRDIGGTWMISYIQSACNMLAEQTQDEDLIDYVIASGQFTAKYMLSPVAKQTWYYTALDIPRKGDIWDEWKYDGQQRNELGEGPRHSGWYTRFFPDCCVQAYCWTGREELLEKGKEFWSFGNRRLYQTTNMTPQHHFATHHPPKDDSILSTARLFYEYSHPRQDTEPPTAIRDLVVKLLESGRAEVSFTAPNDTGGRAVRYQVKVTKMPVLPYERWEYRRDSGTKRNWWRATNCKGEPVPKSAGSKEKFFVKNVPDANGQSLYFAVRSFDDSSNRSSISNVFKAE